MKTLIIIFLLGLAGVIVGDYFNQVLPQAALQAAPNEHPAAQAFLDQVATSVDLTQSPIVERTFSVGYIDHITIRPGFRIIHNPDMGKKVIVRAPEAAYAFLALPSFLRPFGPSFDRPVRIKQAIEVELNLHKHGSRMLKIGIAFPHPGRTDFPPEFITKGPLAVELLYLHQIPANDIQLDCQNLVVSTYKNLEHLRGKVGTLEFHFQGGESDYKPDADAPNLVRDRVIHTPAFTWRAG